jgi:hypothetical protein
MRSLGSLKNADAPVADEDLVNKKYVDQLVVSAAVMGGVFVTDLSPTAAGIVGGKQYVPNTVPANKVITEGTTDTANVRVSIVAEGASAFYSPTVMVDTVPPRAGFPKAATLTEDAYDKRLFNGYVDITGVTEDTQVLVTSSSGASAEAIIHAAPPGPAISELTIGALPGTQTEAKDGDVVPVSGKVENSAMYIEVIQAGAAKALSSLTTIGAADSGGAGFRTFSGTFTVGGGTGAQNIVARARNVMGTFGANKPSDNTVTLNQTYPTIGARTIAYPAGQTALKGNETATVTANVTNADTVAYSGNNLSVADANTYAPVKTVTRTGGTYVYNTNNYTITATKASNGAVTTAQAAVNIADAAATAAISIAGNPARLTSSIPSGEVYAISITANQVLSAAPTLDASSGTWEGAWTFAAGKWTRNLRITDAAADGPQTFSNLHMPGLAKVDGTVITAGAAYVVGGFKQRTLTFAAFSQLAPIGTNVVDFSKVRARYSGTASDLTRQASTANAAAAFTITDADGNYNPTGGYLYLADAAFAGSNTLGTLQVDVEEVA